MARTRSLCNRFYGHDKENKVKDEEEISRHRRIEKLITTKNGPWERNEAHCSTYATAPCVAQLSVSSASAGLRSDNGRLL